MTNHNGIRVLQITTDGSEDMSFSDWTIPSYLDELFMAGFDEFIILSADDTSVSLRYIGNQGIVREIIWQA